MQTFQPISNQGAQGSDQAPVADAIEQLKVWQPEIDWLSYVQHYSQLLMALIEPGTFSLRYANDYFCRLTGIDQKAVTESDQVGREIRLLELFPDLTHTAIGSLYRQHVLYLVLRDLYHLTLPSWRVLDEPVIFSLNSSLYAEPRWIKLAIRSPQIKVSRINLEIDELADLNLQQISPEACSLLLMDTTVLEAWGQRLCLENYQLEGLLLLEGSDVTEQESLRHTTQLLIERDSILRPDKFRRINKRLRSLFRCTNTLILNPENDQARLFMGQARKELKVIHCSMQSLAGSHLLRAAEANRVWNVPDLTLDCPTEFERSLLQQGIRSLLVIPLVAKSMKTMKKEDRELRNKKRTESLSPTLVGVVGLMSDRPFNFDSVDCKHAEELIPPLTAVALRQVIQQRFSDIHPAVEWRFLQEAERRSWGLPPETIAFNNVYPLYGISDIRGSSEERNRSIQADLLAQFQLALNVVEAVCKAQQTALGEQLRIDLLTHIEQIQEKLTVDAEVTTLKYLSDRIEIYFDYFAQCSAEAKAAVEAYHLSCANDHKSVYIARAQYDQMINQINGLLKETWDRRQVRMQQVIPHYCDVELTDGINHMIYVGESIDPKFSLFHLRSLRYEQLQAICDCARTAFNLQTLYGTKLEVTHLVLIQDLTIDIFHDENTEKLFEVRGTRDIRYEIVKKRIEKAVDEHTQTRITQPGMLTLVYSTEEEWAEYQQYFRYLAREGWVGSEIQSGNVEMLQGINGLKFARVRILPAPLTLTGVSS